jgi:hypothetical protein
VTGLEPANLEAVFRNGIKVRLRFEQNSRWCMWISGGKFSRRKDFVTPYLDHAKRTAEHWYGAPIDGWHEPEVSR